MSVFTYDFIFLLASCLLIHLFGLLFQSVLSILCLILPFRTLFKHRNQLLIDYADLFLLIVKLHLVKQLVRDFPSFIFHLVSLIIQLLIFVLYGFDVLLGNLERRFPCLYFRTCTQNFICQVADEFVLDVVDYSLLHNL